VAVVHLSSIGFRMTRIAVVINDLPFLVSHRFGVVSALCQQGYDVHVIAPPSSPECIAAVRKSGAFILEWDVDRRSTNVVREASSLASLIHLYRQLRPDVVHHVTPKPVLYGSLAARLTGVKYIINAISGLGSAFTGPPTVATYISTLLHRLAHGRRLTRTIVQNMDDFNFVCDRGIAPRKQVRLIRGSGVDPDAYLPASALALAPVVIIPARMLYDKGIAEAVEATVLLRNDGVRCDSILAGGTDLGNPRSIPEDRLRTWHDTGKVQWLGHVENMPGLFRAARIACLPSYREGLPRALIEAASCGLPLIACDVPGCREIVRHGDNGFLVPPRDPKALSAAIGVLLGDYDLCVRMGRRGRERVISEFSLNGVINQHLSVYNDLINDHSLIRRRP